MTPMTSDSLNDELRISGLSIVPGVALGKAFFLGADPLPIHELTLPQEDVEREIRRYYTALNRSTSDLVALEKKVKEKQGQQEIAAILQAHLAIIKDPLLTEEVVSTIRKDRKNAEYVLSAVLGKVEQTLSLNVEKNAILADRVQDIHDVSNRVIGHLCCKQKVSLGEVEQNIIVFADALTPSDIASANSAYIRGFVSQMGAKTSHAAIVSRAKNIPYIANFSREIWDTIRQYSEKLVLIRGEQGEIIFNPKSATLEAYYKNEQHFRNRKVVFKNRDIETFVSAHAISLDEIHCIRKIDPLLPIGLFRSEFLALALQRIPSFTEQLDVYMQLASLSSYKEGPVLRLFDFGEDKPCFSDANLQKQRSVRWLLQNPQVLKGQLKALLAASMHGKIRILIPGVIDVFEILSVKKYMQEVCEEVTFPYLLEHISWGSMIELPSAVWMIDEILMQCDFISIGTNDLTQHTLGLSRNDASQLYSTIHPALIRMIHYVARHAQRRGISVCICGEAAADASLTPLFVGLGIQELSVSLSMVFTIQQQLMSLQYKHCLALTEQLLKASSSQDIQALLNKTADRLA